MNPEITQLIERYLLNELSQAERQSFELQLAENDQLLQQVILHRQLHEAAKRASQRNAVQQTAKRYHFRKNVVNASIAVFVVATITAITVWATNRTNIQQQENAEQALISQLEADKHTPLEHIVAEYFHLNQQDTVVFSKTGVLLSIPDGAFLLNGLPYSGPKMIQWQEAINAADIVKAGLSTFAGEHLLETQGMFALQAFAPDGTKLGVNPEVGVYVQVPVDELKEGMMLFEGKKMNNGLIDWQNPEQLTKLPQLADMKDLDFYPPDYEAKLNELKWKTGKKERDSLYLSFEDEERSFSSIQENRSTPSKNTVVEPQVIQTDVNFRNPLYETNYGVNYQIESINANQFYLILAIDLKEGYTVLSKQMQEELRIRPVELKSPSDGNYRLLGELEETDIPTTLQLDNKPVLGFKERVTYRQKVEVTTKSPTFEINFLYTVYHKDGVENEGYRTFIPMNNFYSNVQVFSANTMVVGSPKGIEEFPEDKAKWKFSVDQNGCDATIIATVTIDPDWHINSIFLPNGTFGFPTKFQLNESEKYAKVGAVEEPNPIRRYDSESDEDLSLHEGRVVFKQKIRIQTEKDFQLTGQYSFQPCDESHCLIPFEGTFSVKLKGCNQMKEKEHIPPSAVMAFWQPKFNNTILATRDFEKRMKAIHATCDKDVLEAYTNNLNKPLSEIDEQVVNMGYTEFKEFATERVGGVELDNPHMNNLRQFYEGAVSKIRKELKKDRDFIRKQEIAWDNSLRRLRTEETSRSARRSSLNITKEAAFNYEGIVRQLSNLPKIGFSIYSNAPAFNCDRFALPLAEQRRRWQKSQLQQFALKVSRELPDAWGSMLNGIQNNAINSVASTQRSFQAVSESNASSDDRFSLLKVPEYKSFSVSLKNNADYGKTMVYLFPKQVKSFQRLEGSGGQFSGRLNNDMQYDLLVVGIAENGFYLYEETGIDGGQKTINSLEQVSEGEFNRRIEVMNANRLDKPMAVFDELEWLVKEQQDYKVQRLRMEKADFRNKIRPIVFPCLRDAIREETEIIPDIQI
jgi:hypothetical protein